MLYQDCLTYFQVKAYLACTRSCPFCQSDDNTNVDGPDGNLKRREDNVQQHMQCHTCGRAWKDVFTLVKAEATEIHCLKCKRILATGEKVDCKDGKLVHSRCNGGKNA